MAQRKLHTGGGRPAPGRVAAAGRSDGRPPPPDCHRVLIRNHSGRSATCGNDTTSATGRGRPGEAVVASPVAPRGGRGPLALVRRTRAVNFPAPAAPCAARGPHTPARRRRKRKSKHDSRHTGRLDCRFTTHLVDRHKTACRITDVHTCLEQVTAHKPHPTLHPSRTRTPTRNAHATSDDVYNSCSRPGFLAPRGTQPSERSGLIWPSCNHTDR